MSFHVQRSYLASGPGPSCGRQLSTCPSRQQAGACRRSVCPLRRHPLCAWPCRQFSLRPFSLHRHDDGNESACAAFFPQPAPSAPWSKMFSAPRRQFFQQRPLTPRQVSSDASAACGGWKMSPPACEVLLRHRCHGVGALFLAHPQPVSCGCLSHLQPQIPCPSAASSSALRLPGAGACEFFFYGYPSPHLLASPQPPWQFQKLSSAPRPDRNPRNDQLHSRSTWCLVLAHLLIACDGEDESHRRRISHPWVLIFCEKSLHSWALLFCGRKQACLFRPFHELRPDRLRTPRLNRRSPFFQFFYVWPKQPLGFINRVLARCRWETRPIRSAICSMIGNWSARPLRTTRKQAELNGRKRTRLRDSDPLFYLLLKKKQRKTSNSKLFRCSVTHLFIWISVISTCWRLAVRHRFLIQKEICFPVLVDPAPEKLLLIFGIRENPGSDQDHQ